MTFPYPNIDARTILYASYVSPFPPHSGERIRALNLISALRYLGYRVEAMVGNYDGVDLSTANREGVRFREIPFAWPRLRQAAGVYLRPHPEFIQHVLALHRARPLSAILLDYGFMGAQIAPLQALGIPLLLGTHNLESALTGAAPQPSLNKAIAIRLRQAIEWCHERRFFARADAVLCVSPNDRDAYARFIAADRLHVVPNFIDVPDIYGNSPRQRRIIMTGSFDNFQNREGLRWFIEHVWNEELRTQATLCVAGEHSDVAVQELGRVPNVIGLGRRDDLLAEIATSSCAIVPILHGGGTRFKCVEAMATRTPVVATSKGCEGITHGATFRIADGAADFRRAVLDILGDPVAAAQPTAAARDIYDRLYSLKANAAVLGSVLDVAARVHAQRAVPA